MALSGLPVGRLDRGRLAAAGGGLLIIAVVVFEVFSSSNPGSGGAGDNPTAGGGGGGAGGTPYGAVKAKTNMGDCESLVQLAYWCDQNGMPEKRDEQVAVIEANPDIGLVYSNCAFIDEHGRQFTTYFDRVRPAAADGDIRMALLTGRNFIASPAVLIRRSVLERLWGFNEALHDAEYYELWVRIAGSSRVVRLDKPLAKWRLHGRNTTGFGSPRTTLEIMQVIRAGTLGAGLSLRDRCAVALRMGILRAKLVVLCLRRGELRLLLVQGLLGLFFPLHLGAAPPLAARRHE